MAVARKRVLNYWERVLGSLDFVNLHGFALQLLVIEEEAAQHTEAMLWHLAGLVVGVELRIVDCDGDDLVVFLDRVKHRHQANRAGLNQRQRHNRFLAQHQHVEWIVILCQRLRDEAVIGGIIHRGIKHSIQLDEPALLVQFILDAGAERNFDDGIEFPRQVFAGSDVMPGMSHGRSGVAEARVIVAERPGATPQRGELYVEACDTASWITRSRASGPSAPTTYRSASTSGHSPYRWTTYTTFACGQLSRSSRIALRAVASGNRWQTRTTSTGFGATASSRTSLSVFRATTSWPAVSRSRLRNRESSRSMLRDKIFIARFPCETGICSLRRISRFPLSQEAVRILQGG